MATLLLLAAAAGAVSSRVGGAQPLLARARVRASSTGAPQSFGGDASMPPSLLADAWGKADKVNDLMTRLKGCSIHVVGPRTGVTAAASLALARRLKEHRYRFLDLDGVVSQLLGAGAAAAPASEMRAVETAVLAEAKAWSRTVLFCAGEPGLQSDNWAALHQGICVHVATEAAAADELWVEQSDVTVTLAANASPDESALLIISEVVSALIARPPKSEGWLKNRELELKARGVDPEAYDSQPAGEK